MMQKIYKLITFLFPYLLIIILGIAGTELYKVQEGVGGSPYVNVPGSISVIDEGQHLDWSSRILHGQIPYKDFWTLYTPLRPYFLAFFMKLFGESILTERLYLAVFPLFGFLAFFSLSKLLTKNVYISLLATTLAVASHAVGERNSLFIIAILLFAKSLHLDDIFKKNNKASLANNNIIISGIFSALSFLLSQEFGFYAVLGVLLFSFIFSLFHRDKLKKIINYLLKYFLGLSIILLPYFFYLYRNGVIRNFVQAVFLDFFNGPIIKLVQEYFPKFFIQPADQWFNEGGYLFSPTIQSYLFIVFFVSLFIITIFLLWKNSKKVTLWQLLLILTFALMNIRSLFYTLSLERRQGIIVFLLIAIAILNKNFFRQRIIDTKSVRYFFVVLFIFFLNWYALSISNLPKLLNNFFEMVTFTHHPKGILVDHPRVMIRVYPTILENVKGKYYAISPEIDNLNSQTNVLKDYIKMETIYTLQLNFRNLGKKIFNIRLVSSQIDKKNPDLINSLKSIQDEAKKLKANILLVDIALTKAGGKNEENRKKLILDNKYNNKEWFEQLRKIKSISSVKSTMNNLQQTSDYILNNFTLERIRKDNKELTFFLDISDFLRSSGDKYGYGIPYPSVYLFVAQKQNPTQYPYSLSNISLTQQQKIIRDLEKAKPCSAVRVNQFEITGSNVKDYLPLVWDYLQANYQKVNSLYGFDLLKRYSCINTDTKK